MKFRSEMERFEEKYHPEPNTGCWIWLGATYSKGYPKIQTDKKFLYAQRVSFEMHKGRFPEGKHIEVKCKNKLCVNPDHLAIRETQPILERLMRWSYPEPNSGCWLWIGDVRGGLDYGYLKINGKKKLAHRLSYEIHKGPISNGFVVDHQCNTPYCINPDHLKAMTTKENNLRSRSIPANNARKTHCPYGHELSGNNLYIAPGSGQRTCKVCSRLRQRNDYKNGKTIPELIKDGN